MSPDLTLLRQQHAAGFTELVRDQERAVAGLARSMGLSGADLEDAVAEAFGEVYRALPRFEGRSVLGTWVYQIAARAIWRVRESTRRGSHAELKDGLADRSQPSPPAEIEVRHE